MSNSWAPGGHLVCWELCRGPHEIFDLEINIPTLLHSSSGSRSSLDISFVPFSLALSCSWEVLQDRGSDHLPILLSVPLSPVFRPNEPSPFSSTFRKLAGMTLLFTSTLTALLQRNTRLFPLLLHFSGTAWPTLKILSSGNSRRQGLD